uniref:Pyridoxamine 5'-phosphate oxidase-related FMN-binding protein n=1 Tax=Thiomonas intermedia (strain K12) TaxID=75379 RepID=D5WZB5_THIK1
MADTEHALALGQEARLFVRNHQNGVLSTLSKRLDGFPFGSVSPYVLDHEGHPVILISTLAEHTKNIDADPRVSLIVHPCADDMQAAGRVTLVGRAERLPDKAGFGARYLRYLPQAESYFAMHDFHFYRLRVEDVRFIGGFGKIHWIRPERYTPPAAPALAAAEEGILAHMNADHAHNLREYCRHVHGVEVLDAAMVGIDCDGFDVRADGHVLRVNFPEPVLDAEAARAALVELAKQARTTAPA